jgi:hypothetical protein
MIYIGIILYVAVFVAAWFTGPSSDIDLFEDVSKKLK